MTKAQIKMFEELLVSEDFKGKKALKHLLWLNTVEPKFKMGDCFVVTDPGHSVYGYPVRNLKAKVTGIKSWRDSEEYQYEVELDVTTGDKHQLVKCYFGENKLGTFGRCTDNVNVLGEPKNDFAESDDVVFPI